MKIANGTSIKRVCSCCKNTIYIDNDNIESAIYYDKKTYHSNCFFNMCNRRSKMVRADVSQKWEWVLRNIDSIMYESHEHLYKEICKEAVYDFIKEAYSLSIIPTTVWQKISNIYSGTFKGMSSGIPPEHLLDMWKRKINMLNSNAYKNIAKGKKMSPDQRLNYDLSVLINKYDSYLKWLEKQKIIEAEKSVEQNENIVVKSIGYGKQNTVNENTDDISSLVDDIFG